ncbi:hypothetical protein GCM10022206_89790 [Streptomyces chiangmaiensis]
MGRHPEGPVAEYDLGIADALPGQPQAGLVDQVGPALDADNARGQAGQQRGLPAVSGPDLQVLFVSGEAESGDHHGDQRGLGGHLPVGERNGRVPVRGCHLVRGHEFRPGDAPCGLQETGVGHAHGVGRADQVLGGPFMGDRTAGPARGPQPPIVAMDPPLELRQAYR